LVGAVKVAVPPPVTLTSKAPFVAEVTVWFWSSWFLTVILAPGATDAGIAYVKSLIVMRTDPGAPGCGDGEEPCLDVHHLLPPETGFAGDS